MNCTDAYREALTRDLSCTASSAPAPAQAPGQRRAADAGREGGAAGKGQAMALVADATVVNGEVIDQR